MIREGINKIEELVRGAWQPLELPLEPPDVYGVRTFNGGVERITALPRPRGYKLFTLADLATAVNEFTTRQAEPPATPVIVFCGRGQVAACLDESGGRREWLKVELPESHEFATLKAAESQRRPMDQKALIRMLRIDLNGAVSPDDVQAFRQIEFRQQGQARATVKTGEEGFSQQTERQALINGEAPPEEIVIRVCVYRDLADDAHRQAVKCAVDLNLETAQFTVIPLAGELERAQRNTDALIRDELNGAIVIEKVVFCGNPERCGH